MKFNSGWVDTASEYNLMQNSMSRQGYAPTHLVLHGTAGGSNGNDVIAYMGTVDVSTHFVISVDGTIWQAVSCDTAAFANAPLKAPRFTFDNANVNPNYWTISIEFCKPDTTNEINITDAQFISGVALIGLICDTYNIPKRSGDGHSGIIGHCDLNSIDRSMCPGTFPWDNLWAALAPQQQSSVKTQPAWMSHASLANGGKKFMGTISPAQQASFEKTWNQSAHTSGYGSGIGVAWQNMQASGFRIGPPTTDEYDDTDWSNKPLRARQFGDIRCEWRGGAAYWYGPYGQIVVS
jgi:N-acetyl-anhydromuramyl-L-alanine amidase AmpD